MIEIPLHEVCRIIDGKLLHEHASPERNIRGVGIDSRENLAGKLFFAIKGDRFDGHDFLSAAAQSGAVALVVSSDRPTALPQGIAAIQVHDTRAAVGRLAKSYRWSLEKTKVIAVVGSAGKTTTKRLIDGALRGSLRGSISPKSFNNDIGVPLTILNASPSDDYLVVEVGTNALGEIAHLAGIVQPDIAVITMIGREHLEGLRSLEHIAAENAAIVNQLRPGGAVIANADAPLLRPLLASCRELTLFGEAADADLRLTARGANESGVGGQWWFEVNHATRLGLSLPGKHNALNALAAVAVGRQMGVADERISQGLSTAEGAPMRMSIQNIGGITICNDAYNANPESMTAALDTFAEVARDKRRRIIIIGDMLELGEASPELHRNLGRQIVALAEHVGVDLVFAVGELSAFAAAEIARSMDADRVVPLGAVNAETSRIVADALRPGDAVLLKGSRGMGLERLVPAIEAASQARSGVRKLSPAPVLKQPV